MKQNQGKYLVKLIRAALRGVVVSEEPEGEWENLYSLAKWNSVEAISSFALDEAIVPENIYKKWKNEADTTLFRQISFDAEREQILEKMAERGLSYLPLKGILIAGYYPQPGMRSMADNDILYGIVEPAQDGGYRLQGDDADESMMQAQKVMVSVMKELGYKVESLKGNHDCYMKEPCFNFEMHRELMPAEREQYNYFKDAWKRAVPDGENSYGYKFSDEDEYIFFIAHAFKHFDVSGCGIRCAVDEYVFLQKKESVMDWEYIDGELKKLGVAEFESDLKSLANNAFGSTGELTAENEKMLYFMLGSGTYGTMENHIRLSLDQIEGENKKGRYWKNRFFVSEEKCKMYYPFFYRHPGFRWLLPGYRVIRGIMIHPGKLWREWKHVRNYKE